MNYSSISVYFDFSPKECLPPSQICVNFMILFFHFYFQPIFLHTYDVFTKLFLQFHGTEPYSPGYTFFPIEWTATLLESNHLNDSSEEWAANKVKSWITWSHADRYLARKYLGFICASEFLACNPNPSARSLLPADDRKPTRNSH